MPNSNILRNIMFAISSDGSGDVTPDNVSENYYAFKGVDEFKDGTLFYSIANSRNESSVELYAPTMTANTGTFNLGGATSISNSGENITFSSRVVTPADHFNPVWIEQGIGNKPFARETPGPLTLINYETSKADILVNPTWNVTIGSGEDHRSIEYRVETDTTITNCTFTASRNGTPYYQAEFGTLTANVEKVLDLRISPNVPVDVKEGQSYSITITSPDGDVRLKGSIVNSLPYFVANVLLTSDNEVATSNTVDLEASSTALISGSISQNGTTTIDVTDSIGRIKGIVGPISLAALTNVAITDIATTDSTRIVFNGSGLIQIPFDETTANTRDYITLGYVIHPAGTITDVVPAGFKTEELYSQLVDLLHSIGVIRKSGLKATPNANLTIQKTAGELEYIGTGVASGNRGQNRIAITGENPALFARLLGKTGTIEAASTSDIDPGFYDDGTTTKAAVSSNQATIKYLYQVTDRTTGGLTITHGQTIYNNLAAAVLNADTDLMDIPSALADPSNLIARIAVRGGATNLQLTNDAVFLSGVKIGSSLSGLISGGTGGGGDVLGPASSPFANIVPAFADTSGKTLNASSDIRMNSGGIIRNTLNQDLFLNTQIGGWIRVNEASAASTGIRIALQNSVKGTYGFDGPADSLVMQHGNTTTVPSDKDVAYFALTSGGRHELGTQRFELVRETEQTMQLLFTTGGINRAGMHYISGTSFNLRFGANPDNTGFDILVDHTICHRPMTVGSATPNTDDSILAVEGVGAFYPPRLADSTVRNSLTNIKEGALIYNIADKAWQGFNGTSWVNL